ncbi:hypothetical protein [Nocardia brasiliensis]|uniref:hypothetical protein n=1 Tax=Nocardia brasiliensis TaxID=37326 RepID=UPI002454A5BE|nr:hypothetical protein [Nocardia brasiliensis]
MTTYNYRTNPATYTPYSSRKLNDPCPQAHPEWFATKDLRREIRMLLRMNAKYGTHVLRTVAYLALEGVIRQRESDFRIVFRSVNGGLTSYDLSKVSNGSPDLDSARKRARKTLRELSCYYGAYIFNGSELAEYLVRYGTRTTTFPGDEIDMPIMGATDFGGPRPLLTA